MKILVIGMCGNSFFHIKQTLELLHEEPGGKGYNQAVGIRKLGHNVAFLGAIGMDISGDICSDYLDKIGVENLLIRKNNSTTYAKIYVDQFGNNEIDVHFGAKLDKSDLEYITKKVDENDLIMIQNEIDVELNKKIIEYSISKNKKILVNPAPKCRWIEPYLNNLYLITPNEEEARYLFNIPEDIEIDNIGNNLLARNHQNVVVTLGSKGALLVKDDKVYFFEALKVNAVDTTGAGDLMNACIAYGIANDMNLVNSIEIGIKACAYSVKRKYVLDSYPKGLDLIK